MIILTEGHTEPHAAKTAASVIRYRASEVVALLDSTCVGRTSGELLFVGGEIPVVAKLSDAPDADTLLIGIAPRGGRLPGSWRPVLLEAIERGMTIVSGLHDFLSDDSELRAAAEKHGAELQDVRRSEFRDIARQEGLRDGCLRIHTVGNDCSLGKMVTAIEIAEKLKAQGHDAKFVATGQTGIMIEGDGCAVDCVVSDFVNGAAERLVLDNQQHDILLVEGQGSLFHPSYSAVTLGLLHGSMPDGLILCYQVGRETVQGLSHVPLPSLGRLREVYEATAAIMHPAKAIGVAMNSRGVGDDEFLAEKERVSSEMGLPVCDVIREGPRVLVEAVLDLKREVG